MSGEIYHAKDLRPGNTFIRNNNLYLVIENSFNKTAMREGIVKCKCKNLRTGSITVEILTGEKLEKAQVETVDMIYSYKDDANFVFMDMNTYETVEIDEKKLEWEKNFLSEGQSVKIQKYHDEILGVQLPDQIVCEVIDCEEAVQGNTVQAVQKNAWIASGFRILVPQFIKKGEKIIISSSDGTYKGRTK